MARIFQACALAVALTVGTVASAAADKMEISPAVYKSYQEYLQKISGFEVAVFAVAENGLGSFYVYCDDNCSLAKLAKEAVAECEKIANHPCKVMAVNHDLRIEFEVYNASTAVSSGDPVLAHLLGAEDLQRRIVGNTVRGEYPNGVVWSEYYDPSGEIRGKDATHGAYTARYTLKADQICYDYSGNDDDWCGQVSEDGSQVYFLKEGKLVTFIRNASIASGNPENY
jgi:hypothetical protein